MSDIFRDWSFGGQLRGLRIKRKITLRKMSGLLKLDAGNYSKLENSILNPPCSRKAILHILKPLKPNPAETEMILRAAWNFHFGKFKESWE